MEIKNLKREVITPERAEYYLGLNEGNRTPRKTVISAYAADMAGGRWNDSPDIITPIMISREGRLIDGQHRLLAVKKSGVPVAMWVQTDCDDLVYRWLDAGVKRSAADQIDSAYAKIVAAIASRAVATIDGTGGLSIILNGGMGNSYRVTRQQIIDYAEKNTERLMALARDGQMMRRAVSTGHPTTYGYFLWLLDWLGRAALIEDFVADFCQSASSSKTLVACKGTIQKAALSNTGTVYPKWILGTLLCAYDHYCEGDDITVLKNSKSFNDRYERMIEKKRKEIQKTK